MSSFAEIRAKCLREKKLFEDPDFPADDKIFPINEATKSLMPLEWKRPKVSYF